MLGNRLDHALKLAPLVAAFVAVGCGDSDPKPDAGSPPDLGVVDAGPPDSGAGPDGGTPDTGVRPDAASDAGNPPADAGNPPADAGNPPADAGTPDAGNPMGGNAVSVLVRDQLGAAVPGLEITTGSVRDMTDADGRAKLGGLAAGTVTIRVGKVDEAPNFVSLELAGGRDHHIDLTLPVSPLQGGTFDAATGLGPIVPAASVIDGSGAAVTGMVELRFLAAPASGLAVLLGTPWPKRTSSGPLELLGYFFVELRQNGAQLRLKPGARISVPTETATPLVPGEDLGLYHFDLASGVWVEVGTAEVVVASRLPLAAAQPGWWAVGRPAPVGGCATVAADDLGPIPGAGIYALRTDGLGGSFAATDDTGTACVALAAGAEHRLAALHHEHPGTFAPNPRVTTPMTSGPECGGACQSFTIELGPMACVAGTTTDGSGGEVGGVSIRATQVDALGRGVQQQLTSGVDGEFCVPAPAASAVELEGELVDATTLVGRSAAQAYADPGMCGGDCASTELRLFERGRGCLRFVDAYVTVALDGRAELAPPGTPIYAYDATMPFTPSCAAGWDPADWGRLVAVTAIGATSVACHDTLPTGDLRIVLGDCDHGWLSAECGPLPVTSRSIGGLDCTGCPLVAIRSQIVCRD